MRFLAFLFTTIICQLLLAQAPDAYHNALLTQLQSEWGLAGGTFVLPPNETTLASQRAAYGCTVTNLAPAGQDFSQSVQLDIATQGNNPWDAGMFWSNEAPLQTGDRILVVAWMRISPGSGSTGKVSLFAEDGTTYEKEIYLTADLTDTWEQYLIPFESGSNYAGGEFNLGFHLAYQAQQVEIAGVNALNYEQTVSLDDLPTQYPVTYPGADPQAPWRAAAHARIEQHRKGDMQLTVQDAQGQPLANTEVRVHMLRHHYAFGTAVTPRRLQGNPQYDATYCQHLLDLDGQGHGFNMVVPENALKWRAWEYNYAGTPVETGQGLQWLLGQGVKTRGHVLLWPGWQYMPDDMEPEGNNPAYLENRIMGHVDAVLNDPTIRSVVREWDVINEISHVRDLENALAGQPGYPTGREIYAEVLKQARAEDPNLISYLNDYEVLSFGSQTGAAYERFKEFIQQAIDGGGPVDGIGFQGHMGTNLVAPDSLYAILEDCHQEFGLPIKITEYDLDGVLEDSLEARYLGDFLTMIFSHPATNGFLMWGFWDGAHWKDNAPLFYQDWSPKPALATFNQLVFDQWWTDTTLMTDADGKVSLSGYYGDYRLVANPAGTPLSQDFGFSEALDTTLQLGVNTSVDVHDQILWNAFPNPVSHSLTLTLPDETGWGVSLTDISGRIWKQAAARNRAVWDLSELPQGAYLLVLSHQDGRRAHRLVLKEN